MPVIKKIMTFMRGSIREIGESIVDTNATRIYEQEILDAKENVEQAKRDLTSVMAQEMKTGRMITRLNEEINRYEGLAVEALNQAKTALTEEVASKIASLEQELETQTKQHVEYVGQVSHLKDLIRLAEDKIREHERQIAMAKTTESVYRATQSIEGNIGGTNSQLTSAKESLDRIQKRSENLADRMEASRQLEEELGSSALDKKLVQAGIGPDAARVDSIMERIRKRQNEGSTPAQ